MIDEREKIRLAVHEAAHAVIACHYCMPVQRAWIRDSSGKCEVGDWHASKSTAGNFIVQNLAGLAGERFLDPSVSDTGSSFDRAQAREFFNEKIKEGNEAEFMNAAQSKAARLVAHYWPCIEILAARLINTGEVSGEECRAVFRQTRPERNRFLVERANAKRASMGNAAPSTAEFIGPAQDLS
jgi:hypothetical protein